MIFVVLGSIMVRISFYVSRVQQRIKHAREHFQDWRDQ